ncbi:MAG: alpha-ribazole phosphatase [Lachnospiraceae bacterium]|nr:alpha-ribazole phosphatase [Lachnospiraceae bacterium]
MELYLVRHGETEWNREGRYYGHKDIGLSEAGLLQAKELGEYMKKISFDKVISSPLCRACDTAKELTAQQIQTDERLKEQNFGLFEGKTYVELMDEYPMELKAWNENHEQYCLPEGESFLDVRARVEAFVKDLEKDSGKILIVAHKGTFGHMLAALMNLPPSGYWNFVFEQGTYSKIDLQDGFAILRSINRLPEKE